MSGPPQSPAPHSPDWLPELEPTLETAVQAEPTALINLPGAK